MLAPPELGAGPHGEDTQNIKVCLIPVAFPRVEHGEVPSYLTVFVAERDREEALCAKTRKPLAILRKHLLNVARKGDYLVVEHALARRARQGIFENFAELAIVPIGKHVSPIRLCVDLRCKGTRRMEGLSQ